jgi:acylphosphatase
MKRTKVLKILGKVQGVYFRESLKKEAQRLGITGWVRNLRDGSVEALVQGEEGPVGEIITWCHRGPPAAEVKQVIETDADHESALADFLRKETL